MRLAHLVVCLGVIGLAACSPQRPTVPAAPALRVVVPLNTTPYAFRQESRLVGLQVDFARELAAALRRPLDLVETDFGDIIPAVQQQRADLAMAGLTITRARQVLSGCSDRYVRSGLLAAMRREDVPRFKSASSVLRTSEPIGVVAGTTGDRFVREHAPNASVLTYPTARAAIDELRQRRVTLVVHDAPVAIWFAAGTTWEADARSARIYATPRDSGAAGHAPSSSPRSARHSDRAPSRTTAAARPRRGSRTDGRHRTPPGRPAAPRNRAGRMPTVIVATTASGCRGPSS